MSGTNGKDEKDYFKPIFKYYKNNIYLKSSKESEPKILDFLNIDENNRQNDDFVQQIAINTNKCIESPIKEDFRDLNEWQMFSIKAIDGLLVIPQILTKESSKKWFNYLLEDIPFSDCHHLRANISLPPKQSIQESNLRWVSFGYHHNWDTKEYEHSNQSPIPVLIEELFSYVSQSLGFEGFKGEAGLINYYKHNSTLCPHSDHSEPNTTAPLFSLSLGSTAIFLVGGKDKSSTEPIIPLYLRDSDLLIMSSSSRQSFHAIPKVLNDFNGTQSQAVKRININIRQVFLK